jgi:hypothetical protein
MKKNRINPIEQHFEKAVLGGVSVALLGVVSMQFLGQTNYVQVGNSPTKVAPNRVFDPIAEEAERLLAQMRNPEPVFPDIPEQNVETRFQEVRRLSSASAVRVANFGEGVTVEGPDGGIDRPESAATTYAMPSLPVPATIAAATYRGTIDPIEAITNEELRAYLPAEQPFDALAVSIEGVIDGAMLRDSLQLDPDGDEGPLRPLPLSWWRGNVDMLGVEIEREELMSDGSWAGQIVLSGMPGEFSTLNEVRQEGITPAELTEYAKSSQEYLRSIAQPAFPPTVAGPDWTQPSERQDDENLSDEDREIARLEGQVESLDRKIEGQELQLEKLGGGSSRSSAGSGNERGGGRRGEGGGGQRSTVDPDERKRDQFEKRIEAFKRSRDRVLDQLADLGVFIDDEQKDNQQTNEPEPPLPGILDAEGLPVWAHDFSAEPGKTYHYRMRVVLNNPLFGRDLYLSEGQKSVAEASTLEGEWSAWSNPLEVETDRHFFVVSASEDDQLGSGPRAAVEVYEFYYGYWRKGSTTLEPGDTIHARATLPEDLYIWDLDTLKELGRIPTMGGGGNPLMPRGGNERDRREAESDTRRTRREEPEEDELPEGASEGPTSLDLEVAAMLLDVVRLPGQTGAFQAVLRGSRGTIVVRDASGDKSRALYRRLATNAREGVDQGRPEPEANEQDPLVPLPGTEREFGGDPEGGGPGGG